MSRPALLQRGGRLLKNEKILARMKRKKRVRSRVKGTDERPRLNVFRSLKHIYAQAIVDTSGKTLACASTLSPELQGDLSKAGNVEAAKKVGELIAMKCLEKGIKKVVFDRSAICTMAESRHWPRLPGRRASLPLG